MLLKVLTTICALLLCLAWTFAIWPGSNAGGDLYAYPISVTLVGFWVLGWAVILVSTSMIVRKLDAKVRTRR